MFIYFLTDYGYRARCGPIHSHNIFFLDISVTISVMNSTACIILNIRQILSKHVPQHVLYDKKTLPAQRSNAPSIGQDFGRTSHRQPFSSNGGVSKMSDIRYSRTGLKVTNKLEKTPQNPNNCAFS